MMSPKKIVLLGAVAAMIYLPLASAITTHNRNKHAVEYHIAFGVWCSNGGNHRLKNLNNSVTVKNAGLMCGVKCSQD